MTEWQPIKGYERLYQISDCGMVKRIRDGKILKQWLNDQGYSLVRVSKPRAVLRVHRIVAEAFVENPNLLPFVNHLDCIRNSNHCSNLEWCTQKQNLDHAIKLGRLTKDHWKGKRSPNAKLSDLQASEIRYAYANGNISYEIIAKAYGTNKKTVERIVRMESYAIPQPPKEQEQ